MEIKKYSYSEALDRRAYKKVPKGVREVVFKVISVGDYNFMLRFYKNDQGDFRLDRGNSAYSNFQIKCHELELLELANEGKWVEVRQMIDTGVHSFFQL